MRPFTSTISFDEARRRLDAAIAPIGRTERIGLSAAQGRIAAEDVPSSVDVPPFSRSAMDGYAVISADTSGATSESPVRLRVVDRLFTGQAPAVAINTGTCA